MRNLRLCLMVLGLALMAPAQARFPQLKIEDVTPEQRPLAERMLKETRVGLGGPWNVMLRSPVMGAAMVDLYNYFRWKSALPSRIVELGILTTAREFYAPYEWYIHYPLGLKEGLSAETLAAVRAGTRPRGAKAEETAAYNLAIELLRTHEVSTPAFEAAKAALGEKGVVDLTALVGTYGAIGGLLNMSEVRGAEGTGPEFLPKRQGKR